MDYSLIENFKFPAPFENQKYLLDDKINIKEKYIEYYGY
jgi:hypothetical protein